MPEHGGTQQRQHPHSAPGFVAGVAEMAAGFGGSGRGVGVGRGFGVAGGGAIGVRGRGVVGVGRLGGGIGVFTRARLAVGVGGAARAGFGFGVGRGRQRLGAHGVAGEEFDQEGGKVDAFAGDEAQLRARTGAGRPGMSRPLGVQKGDAALRTIDVGCRLSGGLEAGEHAVLEGLGAHRRLRVEAGVHLRVEIGIVLVERLSEMKCEKAGMEEYREQQETAAGAPGSAGELLPGVERG